MQIEKLTDEQIADLEEKVVKLVEVVQSWHQTGIPEKTILVLLSHYTWSPTENH